MKHLLFSLAALVVLILLAGAVGVTQVHLQARGAPSGHGQYVAMGSSYGAGNTVRLVSEEPSHGAW